MDMSSLLEPVVSDNHFGEFMGYPLNMYAFIFQVL